MFETIIKIIYFFWDIRKTGFYEILSPFVYPQTGKAFAFRTVIYLDADFHNFVPNMASVAKEDSAFEAYYEACYQQHIQKIYDFLASVNQGSSFWGNVVVVPFLVIVNFNVLVDLYAWIWQGQLPDFVRDIQILFQQGTFSKELIKLILNILTLTGAFSIRKFLVRIAIRLLMRLGFWLVKVYDKRKKATKYTKTKLVL
jgi:hypothetical protein